MAAAGYNIKKLNERSEKPLFRLYEEFRQKEILLSMDEAGLCRYPVTQRIEVKAPKWRGEQDEMHRLVEVSRRYVHHGTLKVTDRGHISETHISGETWEETTLRGLWQEARLTAQSKQITIFGSSMPDIPDVPASFALIRSCRLPLPLSTLKQVAPVSNSASPYSIRRIRRSQTGEEKWLETEVLRWGWEGWEKRRPSSVYGYDNTDEGGNEKSIVYSQPYICCSRVTLDRVPEWDNDELQMDDAGTIITLKWEPCAWSEGY